MSLPSTCSRSQPQESRLRAAKDCPYRINKCSRWLRNLGDLFRKHGEG
jgi:hypothetical protein